MKSDKTITIRFFIEEMELVVEGLVKLNKSPDDTVYYALLRYLNHMLRKARKTN